ncbi:MAG: sulfatase [Verrucomicrobia bacterium 12-59-8]|nr:MAG: sulfatase [Verrucomicrobia bacterium 12-59-8]
MSFLHQPTPFLRRDILGGLGSIAVASMLKAEEAWRPPSGLPVIPQKAKRVIWLFMRGGVSHMESFDPKPMLTKYAGKSIGETPFKSVQDPAKLKKVRVVVVNDANGQQRNVIYPLQTGFKRYGQCGVEISDWFPHIGSCADEIAFIRSMWTTDDNHGAQVQFHSGRHMLEPRVPTIGAWISYGLGSMTDNLPSFINMGPRFFDIRDGHYLVHKLNRLNAAEYPGDKTLAARMKSYQLAYNMQAAVPETMNLDAESAETKKMYGMDEKVTEPFARQLIVARRLAERGVRFIQLQHGDGAAGAWDSHSGLKKNHSMLAQQVDKPIAGLLKDLKQRGMLDDTLVVFATEFGRTPGTQGSDGRDHHPFGFSVWMAGGGVKGGTIHGSTDELGFHAEEHPHYVTDVHATIMHLLGLDPHQLEIPGRKRLERDFGQVIPQILG